MKVLLTSSIVLACIVIMSCNKNSSGPNPGAGANSLWPLTQGNTWYYNDTVFYADSAAPEPYLDTMTVTKNTYTDQYGTVYLEMNNYNGWFIGSYIAVDPTNDAIYEADSPYYSPYTAFAVAQTDGQVIEQDANEANPNNFTCPLTTTLYGFVTPVTVGTYSCLENVLVTTDCNSVPLEEIYTYDCPGTGIVRIEDDEADSSSTTGGITLYKAYSQTLTSATIVK